MEDGVEKVTLSNGEILLTDKGYVFLDGRVMSNKVEANTYFDILTCKIIDEDLDVYEHLNIKQFLELMGVELSDGYVEVNLQDLMKEKVFQLS